MPTDTTPTVVTCNCCTQVIMPIEICECALCSAQPCENHRTTVENCPVCKVPRQDSNEEDDSDSEDSQDSY